MREIIWAHNHCYTIYDEVDILYLEIKTFYALNFCISSLFEEKRECSRFQAKKGCD